MYSSLHESAQDSPWDSESNPIASDHDLHRRFTSTAVVGMMMALAVLAREPILICIRRLFARPPRSSTEQAVRLLSLPSLRAAVIGHGKGFITETFGRPKAQSGGTCSVWYYPLHQKDRLVMAISFHLDRAIFVEFFHAP